MNTLRTDAECAHKNDAYEFVNPPEWEWVVPADFARQLETELADHENASNYTSEILDEMNIPSVTSAGEGPGSIGLEQRLDLALLKSKSMERELAAMTSLADRLEEASKTCFDALERIGWPNEAETLREALAAYENHKKGNTP